MYTEFQDKKKRRQHTPLSPVERSEEKRIIKQELEEDKEHINIDEVFKGEKTQYTYFSLFCPAVPFQTFLKVRQRLYTQCHRLPYNWKDLYESRDLKEAQWQIQSFRINMLAFGLVPRPFYDPVNNIKSKSPVDFLFDFTSYSEWYREGSMIDLIKRRAELLCPLIKSLPEENLRVEDIINIETMKDKVLFYFLFWSSVAKLEGRL